MTQPILELRDIQKRFTTKQDVIGRLTTRLGLSKAPAVVHAVDGINLTVNKGEVLGLVGESGCGKSTLGRIVAGIMEQTEGSIHYKGQSLSDATKSARDEINLKVQMIFQDPYASLNPRMRVGEIIGEAPGVHGMIEGNKQAYVVKQLKQAGLDPSVINRFPHQFSGGQRQRVGIARALAVHPEFIVCDEAVAALDVSIQAQIINLFMDLRDDFDLTYLFISHNLGVVEHISDRVAIMYLGRIVEHGSKDEIFTNPQHPYTQALLQELPRLDVRKKTFSTIKGDLPSPVAPPSGCHFHPRCPFAMARCAIEAPVLRSVASQHESACHLNDQA